MVKMKIMSTESTQKMCGIDQDIDQSKMRIGENNSHIHRGL